MIVVAGARPDLNVTMSNALEMATALQEYLSDSQAARVAARLVGVDRRALYQKLSANNPYE